MKIFINIILFIFLVLINSYAQNTEVLSDTNGTIPEFDFVTLDGKSISSNNLKGKIVILDFWNSTCVPCRESMPQLEELFQKYKNDERVKIYFINSGWESIEAAKKFANKSRSSFLFFSFGGKYDLPFAYDNESKTMKKFNLDSNPSTVIIDKHFKVHVKHSGFIEDFYEYLDKHIEQLLNQS